MKAVSLIQPYASAVPLGLKRIETRSWRTHYRGPIAIHASKTMPCRLGETLEIGTVTVERDRGGLLLRGPELAWPYRLPQGAIVALANLYEVRPTDSIECAPADDERPWGDYSAGRFAWCLNCVERLRTPIPAAGSLGLWDWTPPEGLLEQTRYYRGAA